MQQAGAATWQQVKNMLSGHSARFPVNPGQINHIFSQRAGHIIDTPANRQLLQNAVNGRNFLGVDRFGNRVYTQILESGSQVWVYVQNGIIQNGGVNLADAARVWVDGVGLR